MHRQKLLLPVVMGISSFGLTVTTAQAVSTPDPSQVYIDSVRFEGDGCPVGSATVNLSADAKALTMMFDQYLVDLPASFVSSGSEHRDCRIRFDMHTPPGWSYSLFYLNFRGFADLTQGARGEQNVTYRLNNHAFDMSRTVIDGPYNDNFQAIHTKGFNSHVWSDCSGTTTLELDTNLGVRAQLGGFMQVDSVDSEIAHEYGILWRNCNRRQPIYAAFCKSVLIKSDGLSDISDIFADIAPIADIVGNIFGDLRDEANVINHISDNLDGFVGEFIGSAYAENSEQAKALAMDQVVQKCQRERAGLLDSGALCKSQQSSCRVRNLAQILTDAASSGGSASKTVTCSSERRRYTECFIGFPFSEENVRVNQHSSSACRYGKSWGISGDSIWVDHGCRATFHIQQ